MRKSLSVTVSTLVFLTMIGCAPKNTARNNNMNKGYNNADIIQSTKTTTGSNKIPKAYEDGVYIGYGDMTSNGRQMAIVTIRNGKIADVDLTTISPASNISTVSTKNTQNSTNANNVTGINTKTTGINSNAAINDKYTRSSNNGTLYNHNTNTELTRTENGVTGAINDNSTARNLSNNIRNTVDEALSKISSMLTTSIIRTQSYDFDTSNIITNTTDATTKSSVRNWQLAVRRALNKASR